VVTQLIDIKSDDHLWTQTYDKKLDDIFAVQTDIAQNIAASLEAKLSTKVQEKLASTPTTDTQAYDYYLKGKEQYYSYTMEGFRESVKFFSQALEIDPSYSLAYAGLGNAYAQIFYRTKDPTFSDLGYTAVNEALKQNPELAEGYKAKALLAHFSDKKTEALKLNMKAIELKPGYTEAIANVGTVNYDLGDISQFIKYFKIFSASNPNHRFSSERIAIAYFMLNEVQIGLETAMEGIRKIPDSYECRNLLFHHYLNSGNSNKAKTILDELAKLRPNDGRISGLWSLYHLMASDFEKAREKALSTPNPNQHIKSFLAYAHKKLGNSDETEKILSEIESKALKELAAGAESYHQYFILARTHAMRDDVDKAVASLEDAINSGFRGYADDTNFLSWTVDPILSNARKKDGFIKLQERMEMIIDRERAEAGLTS
jgi:tetratricopeptide (TPR) repeat protein